MDFQKMLFSLRDQLGWSQQKVADLIPGGVTPQTVGRWERGQNMPNATTQEFVVARLKSVLEAQNRLENDRAYSADVDALVRLKENPMTLEDFANWFESLPEARKISVAGIVKAHIPEAFQNEVIPSPARTSTRPA